MPTILVLGDIDVISRIVRGDNPVPDTLRRVTVEPYPHSVMLNLARAGYTRLNQLDPYVLVGVTPGSANQETLEALAIDAVGKTFPSQAGLASFRP